jgi:hypothetical protein
MDFTSIRPPSFKAFHTRPAFIPIDSIMFTNFD